MFYRTLAYFSLTLFLGCAWSPQEMVQLKAQHQAELDRARRDPAKLLELCKHPPLAHKNFRWPWTNTEIGQQACDQIRGPFEETTAKAISTAKEAGGAACLQVLLSRFLEGRDAGAEALPWRQEDTLRAALAPTAEGCVAELEKLAADGTGRAVFASMAGNENVLKPGSLDPALHARLAKLWDGAPKKALHELEDAAHLHSAQNPLAGAMFFASAACAAKTIGNQGRTSILTRKAQELVLSAGADKLKVTLNGPPAVVDAVKARGAGVSVAFVGPGELQLEVAVGAPKFRTGRAQETRTAERTVSAGLRVNPAYRNVKEHCETMQRWMERERESCQRNGPKNTNCRSWPSRQKMVEDCHKKLAGIKPEVAATKTEKTSYDVLRIFGEATGAISLKDLKTGKTAELNVQATVDHVEHGSVPGYSVGSTPRALPVTEPELRAAYDAQVTLLIADAVRSRATEMFAKLLVTAAKSTVDEERAAAVLRYYVVSNKRLDDRTHTQLTRILALPTRQAFHVLTGK